MKRIAVIGDFNQNEESHYLIMESIKNVAEEMQGEIEAQWIMSDALDVSEKYLKRFDGFWFSPGSPYKNAENVLAAIQYARENGVPALGTCAGFQYMVIEFARNVLGLDSADSEENGAKREDAVIARLACTLMNQKEQLEMTNPDSPLARMAGGDRFIGEYRCNYGFNEAFCGVFQNSDMINAVVEMKNRYLRGFELKEHPFFVGTLFIPQLDFRGNNSYRIIKAYIKAVLSVTDFTTITACGECCVGCSKKIEGSCPGCIEADGRVPEWAESGRCKVHACAREHGVQFCGLCKEFPCEKLPAIISWNADIIDHLTALRNEYMQR